MALVDLNEADVIVDPLGHPSPTLLRYLLDRGGFLTQQEAALAALRVNAGGALSGGGLLSSTPTISLDALSPNPAGSFTNSDITVDQYGRVTAAANGSSGGGSGVAYVQGAGVRLPGVNATYTATLGATPTVGNMLVYFFLGYAGGSYATNVPSGMTILKTASPVSYQGYTVAYRVVQSGDGAAWGITTTGGSNDIGAFVVFEVSGLNDIEIYAGSPTASGTYNYTADCRFGNTSFFDVTGIERDNINAVTGTSGATLLFDGSSVGGGSANHPAVFGLASNLFGTFTATWSNGASYPVYTRLRIK